MENIIVLASLFGSVALALYFAYVALLPKPLPGIPYNHAAAKQILGDVPEILAYLKETHEVFQMFAGWCYRMNSPIIQVFGRPGGKPWVILNDQQEAYDVMNRRAAEFDRSMYFGDLFRAYIPYFSSGQKTGEQWKHQKRLVADTMAPSFLATINAPAIYSSLMQLVGLWKLKAKLAAGRPMDLEMDVSNAMLDSIWAAAFGEPVGSINAQCGALDHWPVLATLDDHGNVMFPTVENPPMAEAVVALEDSSEIITNSPLGAWHHEFAIRFYPRYRNAMKLKKRLLTEKMLEAQHRLKGVRDDSSSKIKCAADLIISRAMRAADRAGRAFDPNSPDIHDELFGYVLGGHDTVASTVSFGLSYLTRSTQAQQSLRDALHAAFSGVAKGETPTHQDIANTSIPWLDAVVEETLRLSSVAPANIRLALCNTEILGHRIPKGTDVFFLQTGSAVDAPPVPVEDATRSKTSADNYKHIGTFDLDNIAEFRPERWLKKTADGKVTFDAYAGPATAFGMGTRGCFGKRLAMLAMRLFFALVVWNFELFKDDTKIRAKQRFTRKPRDLRMRMKQL